jgi:phosphoribosylglycinamide formyltransferase-1
MRKKVISFLVSGRGLIYRAVAQSIINGQITASLGVVISDRGDAEVLKLARKFDMKAIHINPNNYDTRESFDGEMIKVLKKYKTDLVVAAGYMRLLSPLFVKTYRNRVINVHPALLPAFPGTRSQQRALDRGVKITGCTTHFIDEGIDTGPIILQAPVSVLAGDTIISLSQRIIKEEYEILTESVKLFCENRLKVVGNKVHIK